MKSNGTTEHVRALSDHNQYECPLVLTAHGASGVAHKHKIRRTNDVSESRDASKLIQGLCLGPREQRKVQATVSLR